jgi:hypothetical protein
MAKADAASPALAFQLIVPAPARRSAPPVAARNEPIEERNRLHQEEAERASNFYANYERGASGNEARSYLHRYKGKISSLPAPRAR